MIRLAGIPSTGQILTTIIIVNIAVCIYIYIYIYTYIYIMSVRYAGSRVRAQTPSGPIQ